MSRHMLLGLKVKHPSGFRLHHFFNRWDALYTFLPSVGDLSVFMLKRALKELLKKGPPHSSAALCSLLCFTGTTTFQTEEAGSD